MVKEQPHKTIFSSVQGPGEVVSAAKMTCQRKALNGLVTNIAVAAAANYGHEA